MGLRCSHARSTVMPSITDARLSLPQGKAQRRNVRYLAALDPDRLLHSFRLTAGLPAKAAPYGGWEAPGVEVRGHFVGHYLSALAMTVNATGAPACLAAESAWT